VITLAHYEVSLSAKWPHCKPSASLHKWNLDCVTMRLKLQNDKAYFAGTLVPSAYSLAKEIRLVESRKRQEHFPRWRAPGATLNQRDLGKCIRTVFEACGSTSVFTCFYSFNGMGKHCNFFTSCSYPDRQSRVLRRLWNGITFNAKACNQVRKHTALAAAYADNSEFRIATIAPRF